MVDYVIETNNLSKIYSKNKVVDSVNMHVEKGKIYGLLGKNGAGKTTTMCMLLNLTHPSTGSLSAPRDTDLRSRRGRLR